MMIGCPNRANGDKLWWGQHRGWGDGSWFFEVGVYIHK